MSQLNWWGMNWESLQDHSCSFLNWSLSDQQSVFGALPWRLGELHSPYSPNTRRLHCLYSTSLDTSFTAIQMTSIPSVASNRKFMRYLLKQNNQLKLHLVSIHIPAHRNSQGTRVLLSERREEDVGKVDEEGTDGLFGRVEEPGRETIVF